MKALYYTVLVIIIFSCKQLKDETKIKVSSREDIFIKDSLGILNLFKENKIYPPTKINSYENTLQYGNIFENNHNYLIINRYKNREKTYYLHKNNTLNEILSYSVGAMFLSDTICDVNNDSYLDILLKSRFRSTTINQFYLQNEKAKLNDAIRLYNTVQKDNQLLGYLKENSPIVKFYKFKWHDTSLDTIEWVAYDYSVKQKKYILSKKMDIFKVNDDAEYSIGLNKNEYKLLDKLPIEYKELDSLYFE